MPKTKVPWWTKRKRNRVDIPEEEGPQIVMTCVYLDYDGKQLGPVSKEFRILDSRMRYRSNPSRFSHYTFARYVKEMLPTEQIIHFKL
jgi:hypothetical protein